jgi:hypothetical protein
MKRVWLILAVFLGLAMQAVPASADVVYTLNCNGNSANCGAGNNNNNFGTVTLSTPVANKVHVLIQLASGFRFGNGNDASTALLWNTTFTSNSNENITAMSNSDFSPTGAISNSSYSAGSYFGAGYDFRVERTNNNNNSTVTALSFDVTRQGGMTLGPLNFAEFNNDNGGAYFFAAQIRTTQSGSDLFWVASNKAGVKVPEPGTMTLSIAALGGLMGLAMLQRRRKLARAA